MFNPIEAYGLPVGHSARLLLSDLVDAAHEEWLHDRWAVVLSAYIDGGLSRQELRLAHHLIYAHGDPVAREMN